MTWTADTSLLYAAFDENDPRRIAARPPIAGTEAWIVAMPVLVEFLDLVRYRHDAATARAVLGDLQSLPTFRVTDVADHDAALELWRRHPELSVADACAIQVAWANRATLQSFDGDQLAVWQARKE